MASWIVHLRIAENILHRQPDIHRTYFAMGNIGPDSGVPDENWQNFDPPRSVTHFTDPTGNSKLLEDLRFFRQHLQPHIGNGFSSPKVAFLLGYYIHLVSDNLWYKIIGKPTVDKFTDKSEYNLEMWRQIKSDWYGLDHKYVRENPECLFWKVFMNAKYEEDYLDFLPPAAINQSMDFIKQNYSNPSDGVIEWINTSTGEFLTKRQMDEFTLYASDLCSELIEHLYTNSDFSSQNKTILEIIPIKTLPALIAP